MDDVRVLVTGGAGYIGSHACVQLLLAGASVVAIDNFDNSCAEAVERVRAIVGERRAARLTFRECDCRDAEALASCALMAGREGDTFSAEITGASEFGVFVRLDRPAVSGLVPMRALAGDWDFDPDAGAIVQGDGRARLTAGEMIRVRLADVDRDRAQPPATAATAP